MRSHWKNRHIKPYLVAWIGMLGLVVGLASTAGAQQDTTRILFVGNSFTYFYNLPQVVAAMAREQGVVLLTRQSTVGGSSLEQHWKGEKGTQTQALIESANWDYVVFNNHSTSPIDAPESFREYGQKFADLVQQRGAKPVFMMTWAYESNPLMQPAITAGYLQLATATQSAYVPAGPLFAEARKWRPDLDLFADDKHPSSNGTYLLGLAFVKYFTGKATATMPSRLTTRDIDGEKLYLLFMKDEDAAFLQQLVDDFDFDLNKN
jgi:hypothetical protein